MTINDREIAIVKYTTKENWLRNIPNSNWLCMLVDNDRQKNDMDEVISKIIDNDVCYVCTVGQSCEKTHDFIDEELAYRDADIENLHLPNHQIVTTWHSNFDEGIWFAIFGAQHSEIQIEKIVVLDMTEGAELSRINNLLTGYKEKN